VTAKQPMNKPIPILLVTLSLLAAVVASADDPMPKSRAEALTMEAEDALPLARHLRLGEALRHVAREDNR
jgi:hypothetical protein